MRPKRLSGSAVHHLVAVARLRRSCGYARVSDVARELGITRGSASLTLKTLKRKGLVKEDHNRFLLLTAEGRHRAEAVLEKKLLLHKLFTEVLELSPEMAEEDSTRLEHLLSDRAARELARFLNLYRRDIPEVETFRATLSDFHPPCTGDPQNCKACFGKCFEEQRPAPAAV